MFSLESEIKAKKNSELAFSVGLTLVQQKSGLLEAVSSVWILQTSCPQTLQMTRGYITSLSRSPGDQYTWLSSLTAFPQTPKPKGGPAQNLRRLILVKATYLLISLTIHTASMPPSSPPFLDHTSIRVLLRSPIYFHRCLMVYTSQKTRPEPRVVSLYLSASCFHCEADPCLYRGELGLAGGLAEGKRKGRPGAPRGQLCIFKFAFDKQTNINLFDNEKSLKRHSLCVNSSWIW